MKVFFKKNLLFIIVTVFVLASSLFVWLRITKPNTQQPQTVTQEVNQAESENARDPLSIAYLRQRDYTGSDIIIEEELAPGSNYNQYIASYKSDGLKIYALLTVPQDDKPEKGWPVIIFNHGFIQPTQYRTTQLYESYVDSFARNGYIVFKSDYRGHGNSEGEQRGGYGNNDYTIDVLNAVASVKKYPDANADRIGMWGHSMGGGITLRSMVVSKDIKAGVIWAGVVGSYADLINDWRRGSTAMPSQAFGWRQELLDQYGDPEKNPEKWNAISSTSYLADISGPLQVQHAAGDTHVPIVLSEKLNERMKAAGKFVEYYSYDGDDHNISQNFSTAMDRSIAFFDRYLE